MEEGDKLICISKQINYAGIPNLSYNETYTYMYSFLNDDRYYIKEHPGYGYDKRFFLTIEQDRRNKILKLKERINL